MYLFDLGYTLEYTVCTREGNRGLDSRGSPSPNFGDGVGTGIDLIKVSGTVRGRGQLQFWGFLGFRALRIGVDAAGAQNTR